MPKLRANKETVKKVATKNKTKNVGMQLMNVKPKTYAQGEVMQAFYDNHLLLHGPAGTGKTFIPLYMALKELLEEGTRTPYKKIIILRSVVASREIGHLPGSKEEKIAPYERPYREIVNELCMRGDAYDILKQKGLIEFECTSYLRGCTMHDSIIVVDEAQNCNWHELDTIITRVGDNTKIIFCGDYIQSDLKGREKEEFNKFVDILLSLKGVESVRFTHDDIVRSAFVKSYIIARDEVKQ